MKKTTTRKTRTKKLLIKKKVKKFKTPKARLRRVSKISSTKSKPRKNIKRISQIKSFSVYEVVSHAEHTPKPLHIKARNIQEAKKIVVSKGFNKGKQLVVIILGTPSQTRLKYKHFGLISISGRPPGAFKKDAEPTYSTVMKMMAYADKIGAGFIDPSGKLSLPSDSTEYKKMK